MFLFPFVLKGGNMASYTGKVVVVGEDGRERAVPRARIRHLSDCEINTARCGARVATTLTDADGKFTIELRPEAVVRAHQFQCTSGEFTQYRRAYVGSGGGIVNTFIMPIIVAPAEDGGTGMINNPDSPSVVAVAHTCGAQCKTKTSTCIRPTKNPDYCWQHNTA